MILKFLFGWKNREEARQGTVTEVPKLRRLFGAKGGQYVSLDGNIEIYPKNPVSEEEIKAKLEDNYPGKSIGKKGDRFTIGF